MLDTDLDDLYAFETRALKQSVRRNLKRFPADFMFELTAAEWQQLITKCDKLAITTKFSPSLPFAFTEQGGGMLSSVLRSDRSINIQIMRVFTKVRQMLTDNIELRLEIEKIKSKLNNQDKNMNIVFRYLDELLETKPVDQPRKRIDYKPDQ